MSNSLPATAADVAAYILDRQGATNAMKLQKLVYYAQGWSLVWDDAPLFSDEIQAWVDGPVCPALWNFHRGRFEVLSLDGDPSRLSNEQHKTVDVVLEFYGQKHSGWLRKLSHHESPWLVARGGGARRHELTGSHHGAIDAFVLLQPVRI